MESVFAISYNGNPSQRIESVEVVGKMRWTASEAKTASGTCTDLRYHLKVVNKYTKIPLVHFLYAPSLSVLQIIRTAGIGVNHISSLDFHCPKPEFAISMVEALLAANEMWELSAENSAP